jgi:hypothetical protein
MHRDEYLAMLITEPATPNQRGAIMREFGRLGFHPRRDRAERLAVCARLLGLDSLESTAGLTQGQAGQLVNALQQVRDPSELPDLATAPQRGQGNPAPEGETSEHDNAERATWLDVITRLLAAASIAFEKKKDTRTGTG